MPITRRVPAAMVRENGERLVAMRDRYMLAHDANGRPTPFYTVPFFNHAALAGALDAVPDVEKLPALYETIGVFGHGRTYLAEALGRSTTYLDAVSARSQADEREDRAMRPRG